MLNRVTIVGNLGADPDVRNTQAGMKVVNFRVACTERWRDSQSGEQREATEWISVAVMNETLADVAEKYLKKGSQVYVEGQMKTRKWTDKNGVERYSTEVIVGKINSKLLVMNPPGRDGGSRPDERPAPAARQQVQQRQAPAPSYGSDEDSDEIPF